MQSVRRIKFGVFFLMALSCFSWAVAPQASLAATGSELSKRVADADNRFGLKLLSALAKENFASASPVNLFISPASIAWAFDMLLAGAQGETQAVLMRVLETQGLALHDIQTANLSLRTSLQSADPQVQLAIANSLWLKVGFQFLAPFLAQARQFYSAELKNLEGATPVNEWVKAATQGKITSILKPEDILPETILILVNALYFKAAWSKPFDKAQTVPKPFHLLNGQVRDQPMMQRVGRFAYFEDGALQAIQIPYGTGRFSFYVLLPKATNPFKNFILGVNAAQWQSLVYQLRDRPGKVTLPRFKIEYFAELSPALKLLGMELPFSKQADFSKVAQVPPGWWIQISSVKHKTYVEVNEEGTEAAAVTAISMLAGSAPPPPETPFSMVVDRPFFAAIRDNDSGLLLFVGAILDPQP